MNAEFATSVVNPAQVLATDGLWEVMTNAEVVAFVEDYRLASHAAMSAADALSWEAQEARWKAGRQQVQREQERVFALRD